MSWSETFAEAWTLRYGEAPAETLDEIAPFLRHRSVRKFTSDPVPEPLVAGLIAAAQSSATSSNLQMWSVVSVQDPVRRELMAHLCGDQDQIRRAAWFFAFLADQHRLAAAARAVGETAAGLDYEEFHIMAIIDAALAAERMVCAAEGLGLGICYIGALRNDPAGVRDALELPLGAFGVFGLCLGWPDPAASPQIKPRLSQRAVWFRESYGDAGPAIAEYDVRMRAFFESQDMKGDVSWSMRSGRRVDGSHMTGRERIQAFLRAQGIGLR